jgi:hypothetical protein
VEKVCFTTHSPATLEALLIWFSDYCLYVVSLVYLFDESTNHIIYFRAQVTAQSFSGRWLCRRAW